MPERADVLRESVAGLLPYADELAGRFLERVIEREPELQPILEHAGRDRAVRAYSESFERVAENLDDTAYLEQFLVEAGKYHRGLGVYPEHMSVAMDALVSAVRETSGPVWTRALEDAWTHAAIGFLAYLQHGLVEDDPPAAPHGEIG